MAAISTQKKLTALVCAVCLTMNIAACAGNGNVRYEAEFLVLFDTVTQIVGYSNNKHEFANYVQTIYETLKEYHELYDIYNDYDGVNNIKTINDNAGIAPVVVDRKIIDLLLFAKDEYIATHGKVNVAFGAVLKIWHDYREKGMEDPESAAVPPRDSLAAAARHTDISKMIIDEEASTVYLDDPKMCLDVGAVAKGYAVEQAARKATEMGLCSGLISVGGNVRAIGAKNAGGEPWNVGIQNPDEDSANINLYVVNIRDCSLVTSGDYERYYMVGDKKYHHIIDPDTLYPSAYFTAVTILCKDSGVADALSTAIFNMPLDEGLAYIESLPDTEACWVLKNGEIRTSANFEQYIRKK